MQDLGTYSARMESMSLWVSKTEESLLLAKVSGATSMKM